MSFVSGAVLTPALLATFSACDEQRAPERLCFPQCRSGDDCKLLILGTGAFQNFQSCSAYLCGMILENVQLVQPFWHEDSLSRRLAMSGGRVLSDGQASHTDLP